MIIPYKIDVQAKGQPAANYGIIVCATIVFALQVFCPNIDISMFVLDSGSLADFLGYMWLHKGVLHFAGNMLFLWVFGNAICRKVGNTIYPIMYVSLGIVAGIVHMLLDGGPVLGASGAIYGIIGFYLILYPIHEISCCLVLFIIPARRFRVSGLWIILWWIFLNLLGALSGYIAKAYWTHIGGFFAGALLAAILLRFKYIERDDPTRQLFKYLKR